jgi:hypothetical protein
MPNYQKGKIYKLWSPSKNLVYYGSTTQTLSQRLTDHLTSYENYEKTNHYYSSFIILECEDYKIELVEEYPCNNKTELERQEGEYIKTNECVNYRIAGRTEKEYTKDNKEKISNLCKRWRDEHKEELKEYRKNYKKNNPEKIKKGMKIYNENNITKLKEYKKNYYETKKQNNAIYKWLLMTGIIQ